MTDKDDINEQIIESVDEDGNLVKFELLDIVLVDEIEYAMLLPITEENSNPDEEQEVVLMKLRKEDEEFIFEAIEDDDEFEKVVDFLQNEDNFDDKE